jgi:hypothetical protein
MALRPRNSGKPTTAPRPRCRNHSDRLPTGVPGRSHADQRGRLLSPQPTGPPRERTSTASLYLARVTPCCASASGSRVCSGASSALSLVRNDWGVEAPRFLTSTRNQADIAPATRAFWGEAFDGELVLTLWPSSAVPAAGLWPTAAERGRILHHSVRTNGHNLRTLKHLQRGENPRISHPLQLVDADAKSSNRREHAGRSGNHRAHGRPMYMRVADETKHLRQLGMSDRAIARALGVSDKTVAKAAAAAGAHARGCPTARKSRD